MKDTKAKEANLNSEEFKAIVDTTIGNGVEKAIKVRKSLYSALSMELYKEDFKIYLIDLYFEIAQKFVNYVRTHNMCLKGNASEISEKIFTKTDGLVKNMTDGYCDQYGIKIVSVIDGIITYHFVKDDWKMLACRAITDFNIDCVKKRQLCIHQRCS